MRNQIYSLALRMLWHPADAEDATQEILIRIVTHLGSFRGESAFSTWSLPRGRQLPLDHAQAPGRTGGTDVRALCRTTRIGLAPERPVPQPKWRTGYSLRRSSSAAHRECCSASTETIAWPTSLAMSLASPVRRRPRSSASARWRFASDSRGRGRGCTASWTANVAWSTPTIPCRCALRVDHAVRIGRVDPDRLLFATHPVRCEPDASTREVVREMDQLHSAADLLRGHPDYAAPGKATEVIRGLLDRSPQLRVLAS